MVKWGHGHTPWPPEGKFWPPGFPYEEAGIPPRPHNVGKRHFPKRKWGLSGRKAGYWTKKNPAITDSPRLSLSERFQVQNMFRKLMLWTLTEDAPGRSQRKRKIQAQRPPQGSRPTSQSVDRRRILNTEWLLSYDSNPEPSPPTRKMEPFGLRTAEGLETKRERAFPALLGKHRTIAPDTRAPRQ